MTMYDSNENPKYTAIECHECEKHMGLYYSAQPEIFKDQFFCTIKCHEDHLKKKKKNG